jgi:hypothetical protein
MATGVVRKILRGNKFSAARQGEKMQAREAIETIKSNWPDERYTMLRAALTQAIEFLEGFLDIPEKCGGCEYLSSLHYPSCIRGSGFTDYCKDKEAAQGIAKSSVQQTQAGSPAGSPKPCACNNSLCRKNKGTHVVDGYCKENLFNCGLRTASAC